MDIKIKYFSEAAKPLSQAHPNEWVDLRCAEDTELKAGERKLVSTGVAMQLPEGYEAIVAPRSSSFKNYGFMLANNIGVIDNKYCGDNDIWYLNVYPTRDVVIPAGERIAEFRIQKTQGDINFIEVESLGNEDRGGFGSTGKN